jgi:hypothetical protein
VLLRPQGAVCPRGAPPMAASAVKQPVVSGVELSIVGHLNRQGWLRLPPEAGQALLRRPSR